MKPIMLICKQVWTVLTALTFAVALTHVLFVAFLPLHVESSGAASPVPPHWSVSLFVLQFGLAGLFQFQSLLLCGCGQRSVVFGLCPASCCPGYSSPAVAQKKDNLAWVNHEPVALLCMHKSVGHSVVQKMTAGCCFNTLWTQTNSDSFFSS